MPSLDDEKTMRLWLRRSFLGALWLATNLAMYHNHRQLRAL